MPRRGRRRRKTRTHVDEENTNPIVIVARRGKVGPLLKHLISELRMILYPNCPLHFKESTNSTLKDLVATANYHEVNHLWLITCTTNNAYLKIIKLPAGPTITLKINNFTLSGDVRAYQTRKVLLQPQFKSPPILVLRGVEGLLDPMFKSAFQAIDPTEVNLIRCKRVVLINKEEDQFVLRHYSIKSRAAGISNALKKLSRQEVPNLNKYSDVTDWIDSYGGASDSEYEDCQVPDSSAMVSLRLVELGPRLTMSLHKIEEGICKGAVIYHSVISKSPEEAKELAQKYMDKLKLKEKRRNEQEENVKRKLTGKGQKRLKTLKKPRLESSDV